MDCTSITSGQLIPLFVASSVLWIPLCIALAIKIKRLAHRNRVLRNSLKLATEEMQQLHNVLSSKSAGGAESLSNV